MMISVVKKRKKTLGSHLKSSYHTKMLKDSHDTLSYKVKSSIEKSALVLLSPILFLATLPDFIIDFKYSLTKGCGYDSKTIRRLIEKFNQHAKNSDEVIMPIDDIIDFMNFAWFLRINNYDIFYSTNNGITYSETGNIIGSTHIKIVKK